MDKSYVPFAEVLKTQAEKLWQIAQDHRPEAERLLAIAESIEEASQRLEIERREYERYRPKPASNPDGEHPDV